MNNNYLKQEMMNNNKDLGRLKVQRYSASILFFFNLFMYFMSMDSSIRFFNLIIIIFSILAIIEQMVAYYKKSISYATLTLNNLLFYVQIFVNIILIFGILFLNKGLLTVISVTKNNIIMLLGTLVFGIVVCLWNLKSLKNINISLDD